MFTILCNDVDNMSSLKNLFRRKKILIVNEILTPLSPTTTLGLTEVAKTAMGESKAFPRGQVNMMEQGHSSSKTHSNNGWTCESIHKRRSQLWRFEKCLFKIKSFKK